MTNYLIRWRSYKTATSTVRANSEDDAREKAFSGEDKGFEEDIGGGGWDIDTICKEYVDPIRSVDYWDKIIADADEEQ